MEAHLHSYLIRSHFKQQVDFCLQVSVAHKNHSRHLHLKSCFLYLNFTHAISFIQSFFSLLVVDSKTLQGTSY